MKLHEIDLEIQSVNAKIKEVKKQFKGRDTSSTDSKLIRILENISIILNSAWWVRMREYEDMTINKLINSDQDSQEPGEHIS